MKYRQQLDFVHHRPVVRLTFEERVAVLKIEVTPPSSQPELDLHYHEAAVSGTGQEFLLRLQPRPGCHQIHVQGDGFELELEQELGFLRGPEQKELVLPPHLPQFPLLVRNLEAFQWRVYSDQSGILVSEGEQAVVRQDGHQLVFLNLAELPPADYYQLEVLAQGLSRGKWRLQTSPLGMAVLVVRQRRFQIVWSLNDSSSIQNLRELPDTQESKLSYQDRVWAPLPDGVESEPVLAYALASDRRHYQAGKKIAIFGWVRRRASPLHDLEIPDWDAVRVNGPGLQQALPWTATGGLGVEWTLPADLRDGYHPVTLEFCRQGKSQAKFDLHFSTGPYRRSEFSIELDTSRLPLRLQARQYSGEALGGARVDWLCSWYESYHRPPGWQGWVFGWQPPGWGTCVMPSRFQVIGQQETDAQGLALLNLGGELPEGVSAWLELRAEVTAPNRLRNAAVGHIYRRASSICVGLFCRRPILGRDEPLELRLVVTDLQGRAVSGVEIELGCQEEVRQRLVSGPEPLCLSLDWDGPTPLRIWARARDEQGKAAVTTIHVRGSSCQELPPELQLLCPEPGELTVLSPRFPAQGVLLISTGELVHHQAFEVKEAATHLHYPLVEALRGGAKLQVELWAGCEHLQAQLQLAPFLEERRLKVEVEAPALARPDSEVTLSVRVEGGSAEVMLLVVDQAALDYAPPAELDPLSTLHSQPEAFYRCTSNLDYLVPRVLEPATGDYGAMCMSARMDGGGVTAPSVRVNFDPLACFAANLVTDGEGRLEHRFKLPSSLTRYQVRAYASRGPAAFGEAQADIICHQGGVTLRPVTPLFVWQGDRVDIPLRLANSGESLKVRVFARGAGCEVVQPAWELEVPGQGSRELQVPVYFPSLGQACLQWAVAGQDGCESKISVRALPRRMAASLAGQSLSGIVTLPVELVEGARAQLELSFSSPPRNPLIFENWWNSREPAPRVYLGAAAYAIMDSVIAWDRAQVRRSDSPKDWPDQLLADVRELLQLREADGRFRLSAYNQNTDPVHDLFCMDALWLAQRVLPTSERELLNWLPEAEVWGKPELNSVELTARDAVSWMRPTRQYEAMLWSELQRSDQAQALLEPLQRGIFRPRWPIHQCRWSKAVQHQILAAQELEEPGLSITVYADDRPLGKLGLQGWGTSRRVIAPLESARQLSLHIQGQGRLHYRVRLLQLDARAMTRCQRGFGLQRSFYNEKGQLLARDAQGCWLARAGQTVEVRIRVQAWGFRYGVLLFEPLAAGLEVLKQVDVRGGKSQSELRADHLWIEIEEPDVVDRYAKANDQLLRAEVPEVRYRAGCVMPGRFQIPSAWAEEPGYPETRGQTGPDCLIIA